MHQLIIDLPTLRIQGVKARVIPRALWYVCQVLLETLRGPAKLSIMEASSTIEVLALSRENLVFTLLVWA
jgi:hypothetical protein